MSYNGWENYETWNVGLWIGNIEHWYNLARECTDYAHFIRVISEPGTPDGVRWDDPLVDHAEINEHFFPNSPEGSTHA